MASNQNSAKRELSSGGRICRGRDGNREEVVEIITEVSKPNATLVKEPLILKNIVGPKKSLNVTTVRNLIIRKKIANLKPTSKPITLKRKTVMEAHPVHIKMSLSKRMMCGMLIAGVSTP